jgi:hypothetical protein
MERCEREAQEASFGYGVKYIVSSVADYANDLISRNLVVFSFAEKMRDLSGDLQGPVPIVKSMAVGDPSNPSDPPRLFMEKAEGKKTNDLKKSGLLACSKSQLAELVRQTTWLQLEDIILAQNDRNPNNLLVDLSDGNCCIKGIDNDICLDAVASVPNEVRGGQFDPIKIPVELPPYIDEPMAKAIGQLTEADLAEIFQKNGRDPHSEPFRTEYGRCCERMMHLKDRVQNYYRKEGRVLGNPSQWKSQTVLDALTGRNSYAASHIHNTEEFRATSLTLADCFRQARD